MKTAHDFELGGHSYRIAIIPPLEGLKIHFKYEKIRLVTVNAAVDGKRQQLSQMEQLLLANTRIAEAMAVMTEEEIDYLVGACLKHISRALPNGAGWAPLWSNGRLHYQDLSALELWDMVNRTVLVALGPFTAGVPSSSPPPENSTTSTS